MSERVTAKQVREWRADAGAMGPETPWNVVDVLDRIAETLEGYERFCSDCDIQAHVDMVRKLKSAERIVAEYEDATKAALNPHKDEKHCECVGPLLAQIKDAQRRYDREQAIVAAYEAGERGSYEKVNFGYMIGRVWSTDRAGIGDLPVRIVREVEP